MKYVLIPLYNEEENIENLFKEIDQFIINKYSDPFFVFVDDSSADNTVKLLNQYFEKLNYIILTKESNQGPGHSFNIGFEWIISHGKSGDTIITMEADCTSDLAILDTMLILSEKGFYLVLASIYAQSGGFQSTGFMRKFLSFGANFLLRFVLDIKVLTLSSFYRIYSYDIVREVSNNNKKIIEESGFISMIEMLYKCIKLNASVIEVPMTLKSDKRKGKSKMKIFKTVVSYIKFLFSIIFK